jgi:hypothetical protein
MGASESGFGLGGGLFSGASFGCGAVVGVSALLLDGVGLRLVRGGMVWEGGVSKGARDTIGGGALSGPGIKPLCRLPAPLKSHWLAANML